MTENDQAAEIPPEDAALLTTISETTDPHEFAATLLAYYHDNDRARRTSREAMYLHLGQCCGMIMQMLDTQRRATVAK